MPSSVGDRGGVQRPGAAERQQGEPARIDPALDRDDAQRPDHLLVRDLEDPRGGVEGSSPRSLGESGDRRFGGGLIERDPAGEPALGIEVAEQQVGVGHGRLGAAPCRSTPAPARRPPSAGRPAGRRRRRARRSTRRRRRPCGRRPSAAGSGDRRIHARRCGRRFPRRPRRRRRMCHPCRARARCRPRWPRRGCRRRRPRPPGPLRTLQAPPTAASAELTTPPEERMISGSGTPALGAALGAAGPDSRPAAATGRRRGRWSRSARTHGTAAAPPRRPRRGAPGTARGWPRRAAARGPGRGTRTAGRSRRPRARGVRSRP